MNDPQTALWEGRRIIVNVGTGGVGKTTTSAAIAMAASAAGLRTLVMTIDPARRLAQALGLPSSGNVEREIARERLAEAGVEARAPLVAMLPDTKRTFDELLRRFAPSEERRRAIMGNRIYQHFSTVLVGAHEYAAVEKLHEVYASKRYDLIVLDTPPSQNALDFLEAPSRIVDFLEQETLQWLLKPYALAGKLSLKMLDVGGALATKTLGRLAGADTLRELAEFVLGFQGMYEGFRDRAREVRGLLASDAVAFVLVSSTQPQQLDAARRFKDQLGQERLTIRELVVNRVHPAPFPAPLELHALARLDHALIDQGPAVADAVRAALDEEYMLAQMDQQAVDKLVRVLGVPSVRQLPEMDADVRDLAGLAALHRHFLP